MNSGEEEDATVTVTVLAVVVPTLCCLLIIGACRVWHKAAAEANASRPQAIAGVVVHSMLTPRGPRLSSLAGPAQTKIAYSVKTDSADIRSEKKSRRELRSFCDSGGGGGGGGGDGSRKSFAAGAAPTMPCCSGGCGAASPAYLGPVARRLSCGKASMYERTRRSSVGGDDGPPPSVGASADVQEEKFGRRQMRCWRDDGGSSGSVNQSRTSFAAGAAPTMPMALSSRRTGDPSDRRTGDPSSDRRTGEPSDSRRTGDLDRRTGDSESEGQQPAYLAHVQRRLSMGGSGKISMALKDFCGGGGGRRRSNSKGDRGAAAEGERSGGGGPHARSLHRRGGTAAAAPTAAPPATTTATAAAAAAMEPVVAMRVVVVAAAPSGCLRSRAS